MCIIHIYTLGRLIVFGFWAFRIHWIDTLVTEAFELRIGRAREIL